MASRKANRLRFCAGSLPQDQNPDIRARCKAYVNARLEVDRNRAGHFPQVDFVATSMRREDQSIGTLNQKSSINAVGVQVNILLVAGGRVNAPSSQAIANRERALGELDAAINSTLVEIKRPFFAVQTGGSQVAAYQKAVDSSVVASEGTLRGMKVGIRTNTDVLDAERQMFVAKPDLAQAKCQFLVSTLQLKAAAGVLPEKDVVEIARLLIPVP